MDAEQVVGFVDSLAAAGVRGWIGGGWGVDALVGRRTREHHDLDVAVDSLRFDEVVRSLLEDGFVTETDWRPVRLELVHPDGRRIDLHPVALAADGTGVQAGLDGARFDYPADAFGTGLVAGRRVPCLSVEQQVRFHSGYEPREEDLHDLALLRALRAGDASATR